MTATHVPIVIEQGATYRLAFSWHEDSVEAPGTPGDPVVLPDGTAIRMQVRKRQQTPVLLEASNTGPSPYITIDAPAGVVRLRIPPEATSQLSVASALYDLEIDVPGDDVYRVLEGPVAVRPNITQLDGEPVVK